jgi:hypothetical protein
MNVASGSECDLYSIAYRIARDYLERVRLSTFAGSAVQKITIETVRRDWTARYSAAVAPCERARGRNFPRPPHHEIENGGQIGIDCIAFPMGLAFVPSVLHSQKILPQRLSSVGNVVLMRFSQARRHAMCQGGHVKVLRSQG